MQCWADQLVGGKGPCGWVFPLPHRGLFDVCWAKSWLQRSWCLLGCWGSSLIGYGGYDAHHASWFSSSVKEQKSYTEPNQSPKQPHPRQPSWDAEKMGAGSGPQMSSWWLAILASPLEHGCVIHWDHMPACEDIVLLSWEGWRALKTWASQVIPSWGLLCGPLHANRS